MYRYIASGISLFLATLLKAEEKPEICTDDVLHQYYANQNMCTLLQEIPPELKNLSYAIYPNDPSYDTSRFIYNKLYNVFPHAIIMPRTPSEMASVVASLKKHHLEFSIRAGGHCYEPGSLSSGYIIDLKNFNKIEPNIEKQEVKIGAGCLLGHVIETLGALDYAIPTGDCPVVGVTGLSLGGGQGVLTKAYGYSCDSIKGITLLNAQGNIIEVNEQSYPDLFWALRGAGNGSYGVVLDLTFKMYPIPKASFVQLSWDWDESTAFQVFQTWQKWLPQLPDSVTSHLRIQYKDGKAAILLSAVKADSANLTEWKEPFESMHPKIKTFTGRYVETARYWAESHSNPFSKSKSAIAMEPIADDGVRAIVDSISKVEKEKAPFNVHFTFAALGGKAAMGQSAFYPRQALIMLHDMVSWKVPEKQIQAVSMLNDFHQALAPYVSKYCYANIVDYDLGDNYLEAYWGSHVDRLIEIKKKYDPTNLFQWKQSVPLKRETKIKQH